MGVLGKLAVIVVAVAVWWSLGGKKTAPEDLGAGSFVAPGWEKVEEEFRRQLKTGLLTAGGFSVYHKGECVVDLTGGYANEDALVLWKNTTMSIYFSSTKGVASVVIAILVDRGLLDYKKPVSFYWPEFAQNGKKDITVEQLVSHQAGLITLKDGDYSVFDLREENAAEFRKVLAAQKPYWEPGTTFGYHALTKGMYEDVLVRLVDPKHRSMPKFFQEEIADIFGIDFYIGVPSSEVYRVAHNTPLSLLDKELFFEPKLWSTLALVFNPNNHLFHHAIRTTDGDLGQYYNNPDYIGLNNPSANGVGTVRSLAKFFGILANGGVHEKKTLLSKKMIDKLGEEVVSGVDEVMGMTWTLGPGTMLLRPPEKVSDIGVKVKLTQKGGNVFGTPGLGGQMASADTKNHLGISYLTNYLSWWNIDDPRYISLLKAVYESLKQIKKQNKN